MFIAVSAGELAATQQLIAGGADVNRADRQGITPLMAAIHGVNDLLASVLLRAGATAALAVWGLASARRCVRRP